MDIFKKYGLSANTLKIIAMVTMVIDHVGYVLFPQHIVLRYIGRMAFPIYCFLLVEGFFHTGNVWKYMARLAVFAVISEVPFNLAFHRALVYRGSTNVFFTLLIGLIVLWLVQKLYEKTQDQTMGAMVCLAGMFAAWALRTDYSYLGVLMIYVFYFGWEGSNYGTEKNRTSTKLLTLFVEALILYLYPGSFENYAIIGLLPVLCYSGKKSGILWEKLGLQRIDRFMKYFFYAFYPLHLLVLYLLAN